MADSTGELPGVHKHRRRRRRKRAEGASPVAAEAKEAGSPVAVEVSEAGSLQVELTGTRWSTRSSAPASMRAHGVSVHMCIAAAATERDARDDTARGRDELCSVVKSDFERLPLTLTGRR